jgi:predicted DNA-binding protein (MmcQ/YjbR family)
MNVESIRRYCMSFPNATEQVQWEHHLLFKIGGKIFVIADLNPPHHIALKCDPEQFAELTEREGIIPAPYLARAKWVSVERHDAVDADDLKGLIRNSYEMVKARLPKKVQARLDGMKPRATKPALRR